MDRICLNSSFSPSQLFLMLLGVQRKLHRACKSPPYTWLQCGCGEMLLQETGDQAHCCLWLRDSGWPWGILAFASVKWTLGSQPWHPGVVLLGCWCLCYTTPWGRSSEGARFSTVSRTHLQRHGMAPLGAVLPWSWPWTPASQLHNWYFPQCP